MIVLFCGNNNMYTLTLCLLRSVYIFGKILFIICTCNNNNPPGNRLSVIYIIDKCAYPRFKVSFGADL